jgi:RNA polymerase III subunit RPC82 helix-turn-helix domain
MLAATAGLTAGSVKESLLILVQHNCVSVCAQEVRQQAADG